MVIDKKLIIGSSVFFVILCVLSISIFLIWKSLNLILFGGGEGKINISYGTITVSNINSPMAIFIFAWFLIYIISNLALKAYEEALKYESPTTIDFIRHLSWGGGPKVSESQGVLDRLDIIVNEIVWVRTGIKNLGLRIVSPYTYYNLKKFESGCFGHFVMTDSFIADLNYLKGLGYIEFSIEPIPSQGDDLSFYVRITDKGKAYLQQFSLSEFI